MSYINEIEDAKLMGFAVGLVERNFSEQLKYKDHSAEIKVKDDAGIVTVKVSATGKISDMFYVVFDDYSAEVYNFANGIRTKFVGAFISFMLREVKDVEGYTNAHNDRAKANFASAKSIKPASASSAENGEENC